MQRCPVVQTETTQLKKAFLTVLFQNLRKALSQRSVVITVTMPWLNNLVMLSCVNFNRFIFVIAAITSLTGVDEPNINFSFSSQKKWKQFSNFDFGWGAIVGLGKTQSEREETAAYTHAHHHHHHGVVAKK